MRKGSGTALSDEIKYLGVFCGKRASLHGTTAETGSAGRERDACSSRLTDEGSPAAEPANLEMRLGEIFHRNLLVARRLVSRAAGAKE